MFDKTYLFEGGGNQHHTHTHNVKVEQKLAPIGEHTQLMADMRQENLKDMTRTMVQSQPNSLLKMTGWFSGADRKWITVFELNGTQHFVYSNVRFGMSFEEIANMLNEDISSYVARQILGGFGKQARDQIAMMLDN